MGSGNSRMSSGSPRQRRTGGRRRVGLAACLCGGASLAAANSSGVPSQTERQASGKSHISARLDGSIVNDNLRISVKEPSNLSHDVMSSISNDENMRSNQAFRSISSESFPDFRNSGSIMSDIASSHEIFHSRRSSDLAGSSRKPDLPELRNANASLTPVLEVDTYSGGRIFRRSVNLSHNIPHLDHEDLLPNGIPSIDDPSYEALSIQNSDSESISSIQSLSSSWQFSGEEPRGATSSALNGLAFARSWERMNGNVRHVDLVSVPSNIPGRHGEINNNEARRNNRSILWDGFSRRSSRNTDSLATILSSEDAVDLESQWLLDISHHAAGGLEDDSLYFRRRRHGLSGLSWHSRPEIRGQVHSASDHHSGQSTSCPSGIHPNGPCSCSALLMPEVSNTRASISRIVMLAEALFEVLDEIHQQPGSVSFSTVSVPAPDSVVNSLPSKVHEKRDTIANKDDVEQCYICLAEYEDGDKIRVLPCQHEYHMSCVDKWLKEIHGVCPLCRGAVESSVSAL